MDLYVRPRDQGSRLGFAPANQKTVFALEPVLSGGPGRNRGNAAVLVSTLTTAPAASTMQGRRKSRSAG
jgi:hypothetical protein